MIEDETSLEPKKKVKMVLWERFSTAINSVWHTQINVVSYKRRRWPEKAASLIEKETFEI